MQGTREIKERIKGISSIKQITRAMEMVAASRLKKVETRVGASRTYTEKLQQVLSHLVSSLSLEKGHPLFAEKNSENTIIKIILITGDKGLCGSYNNNIIQKVVRYIAEKHDKDVRLILIGKKGNVYFSKRRDKYTIEKYHQENVEKLEFNWVKSLSSQLINEYNNNEYAELHIFFTKFLTVMQSQPTSIRLFPIDKSAFESQEKSMGEYIFEPTAEEILNNLFPKYIETQLYQCILESLTSEYAARRVAMIAATENAGEMIDDLTRAYNKARQESITKELLEVVSGSEALR